MSGSGRVVGVAAVGCRWALLCVLLACGVWLVVAAAAKMGEPEMFALTIASQGLLGPGFVGFAARAVPIVELLVGGAAVVVVFSGSRVAGVVAGMVLSVLFLVFAGYALLLHFSPPPEPVGCGCGFWRAPVENWAGLASRNAMIVGGLSLLSMLMWKSERWCGVDGGEPGGARPWLTA